MNDNEKKQFNLSLSDEGVHKVPRTEPVRKKSYSVWFYLGAFGNIGLTIALPIVLGVVGGSMIDSSRGTKPVVTLIGLVIGLFFSMVSFIRTVITIARGDYNPK